MSLKLAYKAVTDLLAITVLVSGLIMLAAFAIEAAALPDDVTVALSADDDRYIPAEEMQLSGGGTAFDTSLGVLPPGPLHVVLDASRGETGCGFLAEWDAAAEACVTTVAIQADGKNTPPFRRLLRVQVGSETIERDITHLWTEESKP
jgi:hypothetical protein